MENPSARQIIDFIEKEAGVMDWFRNKPSGAVGGSIAAPAPTPPPKPEFRVTQPNLNEKPQHNYVAPPPDQNIGNTSSEIPKFTPMAVPRIEEIPSENIFRDNLTIGSRAPSTVTPIAYKKKVYGDDLYNQMMQAHKYNAENNLPGNQNNWARPIPVVSDDLTSMHNPHYVGDADALKSRAEAYGWSLPPNMTRAIKMYGGNSQMLPIIKENPERYGLIPSQVDEFLRPEEMLRHESGHSGLQDANVEDYDRKNLMAEQPVYEPKLSYEPDSWKTPLSYRLRPKDHTSLHDGSIAGSGHDTQSGEMRNYLSRLQEDQYRNTGKRINSPEEYKNFYNTLGVDNPDENFFEQNIQKLPIDTQRMYRRMRAIKQKYPKEYQNTIDWQSKVVPGIVNNSGIQPKVASANILKLFNS